METRTMTRPTILAVTESEDNNRISRNDEGLLYASRPSPAHSRSPSPRFNIADFERPQVPVSAAVLDSRSRETSYASDVGNLNLNDLDYARSHSNSPVNRYGKSTGSILRSSFLGRSASKLVSRAITTTADGSVSPTKALGAYFSSSGNSQSTDQVSSPSSGIPSSASSASRASVRAKTASASKVIFDNYFSGIPSNDVVLGRQQRRAQHTRSTSVISQATAAGFRENAYDIDYEDMMMSSNVAPHVSGYTRAPARTRPRRAGTSESTGSVSGYAHKIGTWFSTATTSSSSSSRPSTTSSRPPTSQVDKEEDPLLTLPLNTTLFPHGPVDPLDPASFNDLLAAASALLHTYQSAYRARVAEVSTLRAELSMRDEEVEEAETRARHLKAQLAEMAREREKEVQVQMPMQHGGCGCGNECGSEAGESVRHARLGSSDSGFESDDGDGDSVFSQPQPQRVVVSDGVRKPVFVGAGAGDLRMENEMLRQRVAELEGAVEGCLEMIGGGGGRGY